MARNLIYGTSSRSSGTTSRSTGTTSAHVPTVDERDPILDLIQQYGEDVMGQAKDKDKLDLLKQMNIDLVNRQKELDQRKYDRFLTQDARQYDSPQSQLARLMSLGIGRDAALSMLGNGTSGSGVGVQNTAQPIAADASIMPSESKLNRIQGGTSIANTVFSGINTMLGLAQFGISLPSVLSTNQINSANAFLSQKSVDAFNTTSKFGKFVGDAQRLGKLGDDAWKNTDALLGALSSLYGDDPEYQSAINEFHSNPLARESVNSLVNSRWATNSLRPDDEVLDAQRKKLFAEMHLAEADVEYTAEQTKEIRDRCHTLYDDGGLIPLQAENFKAQTSLLGEQKTLTQIEQSNAKERGILLGKQADLTEAQVVYTDVRRQEQEYTNMVQSATALAYELNFDDVTQANINKLKLYAAEMSFYNSDEMRAATFGRLLADEEAARTLATLNIYRNKVDLELAEQYDGMFALSRAFEVYNIPKIIGTVENMLTQKDARFMMLTKSVSNMIPMMKGSVGIGTSAISGMAPMY